MENNVRFSLATDGIPDLEDLWNGAIEEYGTIPKGEIPKGEMQKTSNKPSYIVYAKTEKSKVKKTHILIVMVYVVLIITELFFYVPYHNIQLFVSRENVPHAEIVGSGYASMDDINYDKAYIRTDENISSGKIVNTSQLLANVSITTIVAIALCFLLRKNEKIKEMPFLDINGLAFADEETILQAKQDYAKKVAEYIKRNKLF